jgi:hypothetical protein
MNERLLNIAGLLKVLAKIVGAGLILYGFFIGLLGIGPDGEVPGQLRIIGVMLLILGLFYFLPNERIYQSITLRYSYLLVTVTPSFILFISMLNTILKSGFDSFVFSGGLTTVIVTLPLSLIAPLSLILFVVSSKKGGK